MDLITTQATKALITNPSNDKAANATVALLEEGGFTKNAAEAKVDALREAASKGAWESPEVQAASGALATAMAKTLEAPAKAYWQQQRLHPSAANPVADLRGAKEALIELGKEKKPINPAGGLDKDIDKLITNAEGKSFGLYMSTALNASATSPDAAADVIGKNGQSAVRNARAYSQSAAEDGVTKGSDRNALIKDLNASLPQAAGPDIGGIAPLGPEASAAMNAYLSLAQEAINPTTVIFDGGYFNGRVPLLDQARNATLEVAVEKARDAAIEGYGSSDPTVRSNTLKGLEKLAGQPAIDALNAGKNDVLGNILSEAIIAAGKTASQHPVQGTGLKLGANVDQSVNALTYLASVNPAGNEANAVATAVGKTKALLGLEVNEAAQAKAQVNINDPALDMFKSMSDASGTAYTHLDGLAKARAAIQADPTQAKAQFAIGIREATPLVNDINKMDDAIFAKAREQAQSAGLTGGDNVTPGSNPPSQPSLPKQPSGQQQAPTPH
jgi:hypothetical protein